MAESFNQNIDALFQGMENFISSKTVVGEPIHVRDTILIPLVDVSFGVMASNKAQPQKHNGGGGMGGKMSPTAVLVIRGGQTKLIHIKDQDGFSKLIEMVPELIGKIKGNDPEIDEAVRNAAEDSKQSF